MSAWSSQRAREAAAAFCVDTLELLTVAASFRFDIEQGLKKTGTSSLRLLPSYLSVPDGGETGDFLSIDFGGTNVRAAHVRLFGGGRCEIVKKAQAPLRTFLYDFTGADAKREELFDFLAGLLSAAIEGDRETPYLLGHTFSFPSEQESLHDARLITWTKEFAVPGVEGACVNALLEEALLRQGFSNVHPVAVLNDTVAVLLAAAYEADDVAVGSIYATGHNICYLERFGGKRPPMILNMESGGFSKLFPNAFDTALDARSEKPGEQRMEKMTSGRYLGELYALVLESCLGLAERSMPPFTGQELSVLVADGASRVLAAHGILDLSDEAISQAESLAEAICRRSARLAAAEFAGTLWHLAGGGIIVPQSIAVEGSFYEKFPFLRACLHDAFVELLVNEAQHVRVQTVRDGASYGAAIAAALAGG